MDKSAELDRPLSSTRFADLHNRDIPNPLYHYTGQAGLIGIIQSGNLRATKVQYMNDATEFGRAVELAKNRIQKRVVNNLDTHSLAAGIDRISQINIFSVSFCQNPDLLSQWRGYSGSGSGYAIGFSAGALVETARNHNSRLGPCIYDEASQITIIDELIDQIIDRAAGNAGVNPHILETSLSAALAEAVIEFGAFFKDAGFWEEDEWRLVTDVKYYRDPAIGFRIGTSMPIPYYCLGVANKSWKNKIADIMVGPCPHPQISRDAVVGLLIHHFVNTDAWPTMATPAHPPVRISTIPYRSW